MPATSTEGRARGAAKNASNPSARRVELLRIAAALFARQGYAQTTVRDIADEAGILSGSLYHHFSSKEAMIDEILGTFLRNLEAEFSAIVEDSSTTSDAIERLVKHVFHTIHTQPEAVALYQNESMSISNQPGFEYVAELGKRIEAMWLGVLKTGTADGTLRPDLDCEVNYRFMRDAMWAAVHWYRPRGRYAADVLAEKFLTTIREGGANRPSA